VADASAPLANAYHPTPQATHSTWEICPNSIWDNAVASQDPIHRSAWKGNSANFASTEFSEVQLR
jgi:hypothetical protein